MWHDAGGMASVQHHTIRVHHLRCRSLCCCYCLPPLPPQRRYMDNVPAIVPLLEREHRVAESRLSTSKKELDDLATDKLKVSGCA